MAGQRGRVATDSSGVFHSFGTKLRIVLGRRSGKCVKSSGDVDAAELEGGRMVSGG